MDNNITALQGLYVALGGQLTDTYDAIADGAPVSNYVIIPDVINAIASLITTNGIAALPTGTDGQVLTLDNGEWTAANVPSELPAVTATDNGSVLKVVDGEWAVGTDATS